MIEKDMTSRELFSRAAGILKAGIPPKEQNQLMHDTLVLCCHEGTRNSGHAFGNLFSQVDYLCNKLHLHLPDKIAVQTMRRHSNSSKPLSKEELQEDMRALCLFISAIFCCDIPSEINALIPQVSRRQL